jgi:hypothetical protein
MTRRRYRYAEWSTALELYHSVGPGEAARRLGIPRVTVSQWARRSRLRSGGECCFGSAKTAAATAAAAAMRAVARQQRIDPAAERRHLDEATRLLAALDRVTDARSYLRVVLRLGEAVDDARVARGGVRG